MRIRSLALLLLGLAGVSAPRVAAQASDVPAAVHLRNECRRAAQVLTSGHPANRKEWALNWIIGCTQESPPVLVHLWQTAAADTDLLSGMVVASARVRDDRIFRQVRATALDGNRPDLARVGALVVLMHYAEPSTGMSISELLPPPGPIGRIRPHGSSQVDFVQEEGSVPIAAPVRESILDLLDTLVRTEGGNRVVSYAAQTLRKTLDARPPA